MSDQSLAELLSKISSELKRNNPADAELNLRYTYYRHHFAEEAAATIDEVLTKRAPVIWSVRHGTLNTLYLKWTQSIRYIADHPDEFPGYADKLRQVENRRLKGVGIKISPKIAYNRQLTTDTTWKSDLTTFINTAEAGETFERIGILITEDDRRWAYELIRPVMDLYAISITDDRIAAVRLA